jgi:hypothetical protein
LPGQRPPPALADAGAREARAAGRARGPFAGLSARDRRILELTRRELGGEAFGFDGARRAPARAVAEVIPAGRIYVLGAGEGGPVPVVGSIVSGVGVAPGERGPLVVRVDGARLPAPLAPLVP